MTTSCVPTRLCAAVVTGTTLVVTLAHPAAAQERHTMAEFLAAERAAAMAGAARVPSRPTLRKPGHNPVTLGLGVGLAGAAVGAPADRSDLQLSITGSAGYTSLYGDGWAYLVSGRLSKAGGVPIEATFEVIPTSRRGGSNATIFWIGLEYPRGLPVPGLYGGVRSGLLKGPVYDGFVVDMHIGLHVNDPRPGWRSWGVRLEPALLAGADEAIFISGRLAAGLTWTFP